MVLIGELVVILGFMIFIKLFGLVRRTSRVAEVGKSVLAVIRDPSLEDHQKELATQQYAKELFSLFFVIVSASLIALAIPLGIVWIMELANLLTVAEVIAGTLTLEFIGIAAVPRSRIWTVTGLCFRMRRGIRNGRGERRHNTALDRMLKPQAVFAPVSLNVRQLG